MARWLRRIALLAAMAVWSGGPSGFYATALAADAHGGHEIGHADAGPGLEDPAEFRSDLALWTLVVFVIVLIVLSKFAWGPIRDALEQREHSIAHHLDEAGRKHDEAKQLLAQYESRLSSAAEQVRQMLDEARRDAEHVKAQVIAEAKASAETERARALRDIDTATDAALKQLAEKSASMAVELAGKIVGARLKPEDHLRLIQEASSKLSSAKPSTN